MTVEIPLSGKHGTGKVALVDDDVAESVLRNSWALLKSSGYAYRGMVAQERRALGCGPGSVLMHRFILGLEPGDGLEADHVNRNKLDNRRENLRVATRGQNMANCPARTSSGYKGVYRSRTSAPRWQAKIMVDLKSIHLGVFDSPEEAAVAYNDAARRYFGEHALLNVIGGAR